MTSKRWVNLGLSLAVAAVIGVGAWQVLATRAQLHHTQHKEQSLAHQLEQARSATKTAESALAAERRTISSQSITSTTTPLQAPFPFVDEATVMTDLANAYSQAFAQNYVSEWDSAWATAFVNAFTAEETRETVLAKEGKAYYVPDPISEANSYAASGTLP